LPIKLSTAVAVAGLCLIVCGVVLSAERSSSTGVSHTLLRSGSSLGSHPSRQACITARTAQRAIDAPTKTSGQVRYVCREDEAVTVTYGPNPVTPPPPPPVPSAVLSWTPPATNTDGSALTNLAGYRISYGTTTALAQTIQVPATVRAYSISSLAPGTYYFAVRAYTTAGTESALSSMVTKVVQ
jgi:hypothetical protein